MNQLNVPLDNEFLKRALFKFWQNPRIKSKGGLKLTVDGFDAFKKAGIKTYRIKLEESLIYDSKMILGLENFINTPFYINRNEIWVFDETTAIQLVLFSGNLNKFILAKYKRNSV